MFVKKWFLYLSSITVLTVSTQCTEIGPSISFKDNSALLDTTYIDNELPTDVAKKVLIEEFTGANCNSCPRGAETIKDILTEHPDSVFAIAIHNDNPLANPHDGAEDMRTAEGIQISQRLGGTAAIPSAAVDRKKYPNTTQLVIFRSRWDGSVDEQLLQAPAVDLQLEQVYNADSRELTVTATVHYLRDVDTTTHLSIAITESGIIGPQKMPDASINPTYEHNHIFRTMLTPTFGTLLGESVEQGRVFKRSFRTTLPEHWVPTNCYAVGFVHYIGDVDEVLQAAEISIEL